MTKKREIEQAVFGERKANRISKEAHEAGAPRMTTEEMQKAEEEGAEKTKAIMEQQKAERGE